MTDKIHVFRIKPEQELLAGIGRYCSERSITSELIVGIIGSAKRSRLNFLTKLPGGYKSIEYPGPMEIFGAQGSISLKDDNLIVHTHIHLSRQDFSIGGHLTEAEVFSTAQVAIRELDYQLIRRFDSYTGLNEIQI